MVPRVPKVAIVLALLVPLLGPPSDNGAFLAGATPGGNPRSIVPAEFQDLYPTLQRYLTDDGNLLNSRWDGSKSSVLLGAEFPPADNYANIYDMAEHSQLDAYYDRAVTPYLNGLQAVGVKSVKFLPKQRDTEFVSRRSTVARVPDYDIETRDHWSSWAPIDQAFLQDMVNTAYYEHMVYCIASAPNQLFAYLDYYRTPSCNTVSTSASPPSSVCTSTQWNRASNRAVYEALLASPISLSRTGIFYAKLIASAPQ